MKPSLKRTVAAGAVALTLVGTSIGVVSAQQAPTASPVPTAPHAPHRETQGQPAAGRQQREQQFIAAVAAKLGIAPDRLQQAVDQTRTELGITERGPGGDRRGGPGGGPGGGLDAAAQALGIGVDQLRQELQGKTLTEVAQAHNVDPTTVANALKAAASTRIDQEVAAGRIPADQAATAKQRAAERIDQLMTQPGPAGRQARTGTPGAGR
jgi:hypothetical protein